MPQRSRVNVDGSVDIPAFRLPYSSFASAEARQALIEAQALQPVIFDTLARGAAEFRKLCDETIYPPLLAKQVARYRTRSEARTIGGVYTEVVIPEPRESPENERRVLINLHGGAFMVGARVVGRIESIPIAHTARIKIVSVDYRMAPEHRFPAASEDVAAVYRALLEEYEPRNIGIYGCSAGGLLTAQAIAWFQKEGLPLPAAIGIFAASTHGFRQGDSGQLAYRLTGMAGEPPRPNVPELDGPYFEGVDANDPLAAPSVSREILSRFPATLFLTGSRSYEMSGACRSHLELLQAGVDSRLCVWDGVRHAFIYDPQLPESREAYQVIANFFNERFGHEDRA